MIDFVKLNLDGLPRCQLEQRLNHLQSLPEEALELHAITPLFNKVDSITGELKEYPKVMSFQGLELRITEKQAFVKNSLHQMHNLRETGRQINYNNFTYSEICENIDYLIKFIPEVQKAKLTSLEFGFNIQPGVSAEELIKNNILMHNLKAPAKAKSYGSRGILKMFEYENYAVKLYDKGGQNYRYRINEPLLRYEVRLKGKELRSLGVQNLQNLKSKLLLRKVFQQLMRRYDDLLVIDKLNPKLINEKDLSEVFKFSNSSYWSSLNNRQTKKRHKANFQELLEKNNLLKTKIKLKALLLNKFLFLINN